MKLSKVKVGMRVKWWDGIAEKLVCGGVKKILSDNAISVESTNYSAVMHPSVLIALKPSRVAREFWVNSYDNHGAGIYLSEELANLRASPGRIECIRVREVLEKKEG